MSGTKGGSGGGGNGFKPLGLSDDVFRGIVRLGFRNPTPVQRKALPVIMSGADSVVMARTGSGKTAAFLIPLLESLLANNSSSNSASGGGDIRRGGVRGIVLSPTRELSLQTLKVLKKLAHFMPEIKCIGIHGGEGMERQFDELASKPDVIVATPGRLSHILSEIPDFTLRDCQMCILDEADRLLEMGFAVQLRQIHKSLPEQRCQRVLLSATMPKMLVEFTKSGFTTDPQVVRLDQEATVSEELRISFITCRSLEKDAALLQIMSAIEEDKEANQATRTGLTLIFCATRHHVEYVTTLIRASGLEATLIYGTLDADARNSNLAAFRNGRKPIMVVTDVAARGVDVPMCDHVIHYHFPPTPKLFVHRSGRVARAGRIGFCFALVEPDELPYMIDLHLFLGRKLTTIEGITRTTEEVEAGNAADGDQVVKAYTLNEMTPEMVHYGSIPESILTLEVENVRRIMDSEMAGSDQAEAMKALARVSANAMKQYRRTRPEASKEGVRRAKAILEGKKLQSGQRVGGASIPPHPLLRGMELEQYNHDKSKGKINTLNDLDNMRKRQEFLQAVSQFRPRETIFEAFATGGGKETGVLSQVDKGRTTASSKKNDSSFALSAMKNMRRQMRMARDKGSSLVVAGSSFVEGYEQPNDKHNGGESHGDDVDDDSVEQERDDNVEMAQSSSVSMRQHDARRRMSKAERRKLKKNPSSTPSMPSSHDQETRKKNMRGNDFRDSTYFIDNDISSNHEEAQRQRTVEAAMQPSAASAMKGIVGNALRLEEAMLDVVGDENDQLVQKQRMMRWDKSKRKYIQTTVGAELSGQSWSKRIKLESGQVVKSDKLKLGEIYEKWQKKTNRSVGRDGVFDNAGDDGDGAPVDRRGGKKRKKGKGGSHGVDGGTSASVIKKSRESKQDMKMKNMKKTDRKRLERNNKSEQTSVRGAPKKGFQGKRGMSGRWRAPTWSLQACFLLLFLSVSIMVVEASKRRPLNSIMCAVGEWNLDLKGPFWMDSGKIFARMGDEEDRPAALPIQRRPWGTTLPCTLSMAEDGTFVLKPKATASAETEAAKQSQHSSQNIPMIRGQWKLHQNPYCVTDRFYDELSLHSYPRIKQPDPAETLNPAAARAPIESRSRIEESMSSNSLQVDFSLYCRMWGLYDRQRKKQKIPMIDDSSNDGFPLPYGRLTHGTVILRRRRRQQQQQQVNGSNIWSAFLNRYRPVVASFTAVRRSKEPSHEGWIDEAYFGY